METGAVWESKEPTSDFERFCNEGVDQFLAMVKRLDDFSWQDKLHLTPKDKQLNEEYLVWRNDVQKQAELYSKNYHQELQRDPARRSTMEDVYLSKEDPGYRTLRLIERSATRRFMDEKLEAYTQDTTYQILDDAAKEALMTHYSEQSMDRCDALIKRLEGKRSRFDDKVQGVVVKEVNDVLKTGKGR